MVAGEKVLGLSFPCDGAKKLLSRGLRRGGHPLGSFEVFLKKRKLILHGGKLLAQCFNRDERGMEGQGSAKLHLSPTTLESGGDCAPRRSSFQTIRTELTGFRTAHDAGPGNPKNQP